ncbi:MAG: hypothetical protein IJY65_04975 [Clostridia bacterium]|nr:hypothetical protein [Clostridia bacterium]
MNKLKFNTDGTLADISRHSGRKNALYFKGKTAGRLMLAGRIYDVKGGVCQPDILDIPDGTYTPVLHYMGKSLELSRIEKRGTELCEAYPTAEALRKLMNKIEQLESRTALALEEIKSLRDALDGQTVFEI